MQDGWTPLHIAASINATTDIESFLAQGAKKDAEDNKGRTPLFIASEYAAIDAVRLLAERKAYVNAKEDEFGISPLHVAAWKGFDEIITGTFRKKC